MKIRIKRTFRSLWAVVLAVLMVMSTFTVAAVSLNKENTGANVDLQSSGANFTGGDTIYFDISSVSSNGSTWSSDSAVIVAIFYYSNNVDWCCETNSDTYSDSNISNKTAIADKSYEVASLVANNIYKVTVPTMWNDLGSVRFLRLANTTSGGQRQVWNYSARMSADTKGTNNCVKINGWDNSSSWSKYTPASTTTDYYIGGRFGETWKDASISHKMVKDSGTIYKYETNWTVKQLSSTITETYGATNQFFFIHTGSGKAGTWYGGSGYHHSFQDNKESSKYTLSTYPPNTDTSEDKLIRFSNTTDNSGPVTIWFDSGTTKKLWYTVPSTTKEDVCTGLSVTAGKSEYKVDETVQFTAKASGQQSGTLYYEFTYTDPSGTHTSTVNSKNGSATLSISGAKAGTYKVTQVRVYDSAGTYNAKTFSFTNVSTTVKDDGSGTVSKCYFLYSLNNNSDPQTMTPLSGTVYEDSTKTTYTLTITSSSVISTLSSASNVYFALSSSTSYSGMYTHDKTPSVTSETPSYFKDLAVQEYSVNTGSGSTTYKFARINFKNSGAITKIELKYVYSESTPKYIINAYGDSSIHVVYAEDGAVHAGMDVLGTTTITGFTSGIPSEKETGYTKYYAKKGDAISITTEMPEEYVNMGFYAYAYVVSDKNHTETLYVNFDDTTASSVVPYTIGNEDIEITPIYRNSKFEYYTVYLYPDDVNDYWGPEVAIYSYCYKNGVESGDTKHMNGAYPGEPMMYDGTKYVAYVPKYYYEYSDTTKTWTKPADYKLSGVTFNNNYNDEIHQKFLTGTKASNHQTYDYDDFVKITKNGYDTAVFFVENRYGTETNKKTLVDDGDLVKTPSKTYTSSTIISTYEGDGKTTPKNGWEKLTDVRGNDISILGYNHGPGGDETPLINSNKSLRIISVGDQNHSSDDTNFDAAVGQWSVIWYVYDSNGKFITAAHPSQFVPQLDEKGAYKPVEEQSKAFQAICNYEGQEDCEYTAAYITYESEKSYDSATRLDGRWFYLSSVQTVDVNAKVAYKNTGGTFVEDKDGTVATATLDDEDVSSKSVNINSTVKFAASKPKGDYKFVGWSTTPDDKKIISKLSTYETSVDADTTLYAVYVPLETGEVNITHSLYKGDGAGNGTANLSIKAVVKHNDSTVTNYSGTTQVSVSVKEGDTLSVTLGTTGTNGSTFVAYYEGDTKINDTYPTENLTSSYTKTYTFAQLTGKKSLDFYSDLKRNGVVVKFNYYDRTSVNGKPADMSSTPSVITFDKAVPNSCYDNYGTADAALNYEKLINYAANNTMKPSNILDTYYYWNSQANAEAGIQKKKNYHTGANYTKTSFHTDEYGNVQTSGTNADKWVTYQDASESYIDETSLNKNSAVKTVNVWYYNTPKKYTCIMNVADSMDQLTSIEDSSKYVANSPETINDLFYNVRIGPANSKSGNDIPDYLSNYGLTEAYVGSTATTEQEIDNGDSPLEFLYWSYDKDGNTVASTNIEYEYRVTSSSTLYAIYGPEDSKLTAPGLTVTANVPDVYTKNGVGYTRLNTTLNPYNCVDNDENISNVTVIYMKVSNTAEKKIEDLSTEEFQKLREEIATAVSEQVADYDGFTGSVTVDLTTKNYTGFKYKVTANPTTEDETKLSSKNRVVFMDGYRTSKLANCTYYVFGAMDYEKYPGADGSTSKKTICSDNYVTYTFNASGACTNKFDSLDE